MTAPVDLHPAPLPGPGTNTRDLDLCNEVGDLVRKALDEYLAEHPISARVYLREAEKVIGVHIRGGV